MVKKVFASIGLPGSSKSTVFRVLARLLDGIWINRDEFPSTKAFSTAIKDGEGLLLIDRCNHSRKAREEIVKWAGTDDITWILFGDDSNRKLCIQRIKNRVNHPTLQANKAALVVGVISRHWDDPTECKTILKINIEESLEDMVKGLLERSEHTNFSPEDIVLALTKSISYNQK